MGFNIFKKRTPEVQTVEVEKVVEKVVEKLVEVPSRFTFAHDDEVVVNKFFFNPTHDVHPSDLYAGSIFECGSVEYENGSRLYPIFKMPDVLPRTCLVSAKKIICVGSIITDDDEIKSICPSFSGESMDEVLTLLNMDRFSEETHVTVMDRTNVISSEAINGDIDYHTFTTSVNISNNISWVTEFDH